MAAAASSARPPCRSSSSGSRARRAGRRAVLVAAPVPVLVGVAREAGAAPALSFADLARETAGVLRGAIAVQVEGADADVAFEAKKRAEAVLLNFKGVARRNAASFAGGKAVLEAPLAKYQPAVDALYAVDSALKQFDLDARAGKTDIVDGFLIPKTKQSFFSKDFVDAQLAQLKLVDECVGA